MLAKSRYLPRLPGALGCNLPLERGIHIPKPDAYGIEIDKELRRAVIATNSLRLVKRFYAGRVIKAKLYVANYDGYIQIQKTEWDYHVEIREALRVHNDKIFWYLFNIFDMNHHGEKCDINTCFVSPMIKRGRLGLLKGYLCQDDVPEPNDYLMEKALFAMDVHIIEYLMTFGINVSRYMISNVMSEYLDLIYKNVETDEEMDECEEHIRALLRSVLQKINPNTRGEIEDLVLQDLIPHRSEIDDEEMIDSDAEES